MTKTTNSLFIYCIPNRSTWLSGTKHIKMYLLYTSIRSYIIIYFIILGWVKQKSCGFTMIFFLIYFCFFRSEDIMYIYIYIILFYYIYHISNSKFDQGVTTLRGLETNSFLTKVYISFYKHIESNTISENRYEFINLLEIDFLIFFFFNS